MKPTALSGEIKVANTVVDQWEELTFDFSDAPNPPAEIGGLKRIIIFPDFNARTQDNICYFDNITFNSTTGTSVVNEELNNLQVYPNPVSAGVNVKISAEVSHFEVYDFAGRNIMTRNGSVIPTDGIDQGVYLVRIHTLNGEIQTQKLVVK